MKQLAQKEIDELLQITRTASPLRIAAAVHYALKRKEILRELYDCLKLAIDK